MSTESKRIALSVRIGSEESTSCGWFAIAMAKLKGQSHNLVFLTGKRVRTLVATLAMVVLLCAAGGAQAIPVSIKLTSDALGLGNSDINKGKTVAPDVPGFITSPTTGQGSILTVQSDGKAGIGTTVPVLVTITAQTRLDVTEDLPQWPNDYHAGIIFISKEKNDLPDGKKEGLGVRSFKVDETTGLRELDSKKKHKKKGKKKPDKSGLAKIEGSKHVSGGTSDDTYDWLKPNGAPHVDEAVIFDFNPQFYADALSVEVLLSEFDATDVINLHIELTSGSTFDFDFLQTTDTSLFEQAGADKDKLWKLKFSGIGQLQTGDLIQNFTLFAIDDDPLNPRGTAEHFWVTGMTIDAELIPEPATICLLAFGAVLLRRRKK